MQRKKQISDSNLARKKESAEGGLTFLEQLTSLRGNCSNPKVPFLYRIDEENREIEFIRGNCGMWTCEACAVKNARKWIARIIDGINKLPPKEWYFATVTAHRWHRGEKSLINLRNNWHKLKKRLEWLAKKLKTELYYVRVWEHHKDGSYHLHLILNVPATTRWMKDNASACGLGYQAHIEQTVNAGQVAGYVAKYMLKQANGKLLHTYPKGARRIEATKNWVAWIESKSDEWKYAGDFDRAKGLSKMRKMQGYKVYDIAIVREEKRRNEDES